MIAFPLFNHSGALIVDQLIKSVPKLNGRLQPHDESGARKAASVCGRRASEADHDKAADDGSFRDKINKLSVSIPIALRTFLRRHVLSHKLNAVYHEYSHWARRMMGDAA